VPAFSVEPNELVALVGGSGSGKSTLLTALAGFQPADEGTVLYNDADLYGQFDALRSSIGYVPQQDIVHRPLTVARVLHYVAQLRLPADMAPGERQARIARVLDVVSLTAQATTRVERLSGGQLKRVSIAVELLAQPRVLFLDEPTSGLDPGLDRKLMTTFRDLADNGQTVLVVTHATGNIDVCDKVAFMAPGGLLAYDGPPAEAAAAFGVARFDDIYEEVDERRKRTAPPPRPPAPPRGQYQPPPAARGHQWRQFITLTRRYAEIVRRDTKYIAVLLLQAPLIGLLLAAVLEGGAFETSSKTVPDFVQSYAFTLALIATWFGVLSSGREICKELPIVRRERMSGIGIVPYIGSKVAVLGALVVVQTLVLLFLVVLKVGLPDTSVVGPPFLAMAVTLMLTGLASVGFGLVLSALVENEDRATSAIPLLLIPQLVLGGVIFVLDNPVLKVISGFTTVRWSTQALGTIIDVCGHALPQQQLPAPHAGPPYQCLQARLSYAQEAGHVYTSWLALLAMAVVLPVIAGVLVRRRDPHQRH
jgi:ABC transport system ATP-binding/permease protein